MTDTRLFEFIRTTSYMKAAGILFTDVEEREIERQLCDDPAAGDTIAQTGGCAKLRVKLPGRGKSAGARVVYFYRGSVGRIYLLFAYGKNEQANLGADDKREMRHWTTALEKEP